MIMQTVELYDKVYIKKIDKPYVKLKSNIEWLPSDNRNLAYRAAEIIRQRYGIESGVFIELNKAIPVAAGLAGGSSDCAAVLYGMNILFGLKISAKIKPKVTAAVIPPAEAAMPPVKAPSNPFSTTAACTPLAREYPNPVKGTVAPAPANSTSG